MLFLCSELAGFPEGAQGKEQNPSVSTLPCVVCCATYSHVHESMPLFASLLVTLIHPKDDESVVEGTVCHREMVHGHTITKDKVVIT